MKKIRKYTVGLISLAMLLMLMPVYAFGDDTTAATRTGTLVITSDQAAEVRFMYRRGK